MKTIELHITLQPQVLDTQGQALNRAVHDLGSNLSLIHI